MPKHDCGGNRVLIYSIIGAHAFFDTPRRREEPRNSKKKQLPRERFSRMDAVVPQRFEIDAIWPGVKLYETKFNFVRPDVTFTAFAIYSIIPRTYRGHPFNSWLYPRSLMAMGLSGDDDFIW